MRLTCTWAIAIVCTLVALCARPAEADRTTKRELALAVAKVAVNESGFDSPADVALIWQVVENHGARDRTRLRWLERHSGRVLGTRECTEGNCLWTRNLTWSDDRPDGWPEGYPWRVYGQPGWERVRGLAWRLVTGRTVARPCYGDPKTWGGPMDRERALRMGFVPLACPGARNTGYAWAPTAGTPS